MLARLVRSAVPAVGCYPCRWKEESAAPLLTGGLASLGASRTVSVRGEKRRRCRSDPKSLPRSTPNLDVTCTRTLQENRLCLSTKHTPPASALLEQVSISAACLQAFSPVRIGKAASARPKNLKRQSAQIPVVPSTSPPNHHHPTLHPHPPPAHCHSLPSITITRCMLPS